MTEFDRYDFALSLLDGAIVVGAFLFGAPLWALALIYFAGVTISVLRHAELRPRGR
jgi:hypothetical protein